MNADRAAVVLHPHPAMGGDSSHPLVVAIAQRLVDEGVLTLAPDIDDPDPAPAVAMLTATAEGLGGAQVFLIGYSWGSVIASHAMPTGLAARVLIAPPTSMALGDDASTPTLVLVPEHDQYGGPEAAAQAFAGRTNVTLESIPGEDHFLWGSLDAVADRAVAWLLG